MVQQTMRVTRASSGLRNKSHFYYRRCCVQETWFVNGNYRKKDSEMNGKMTLTKAQRIMGPMQNRPTKQERLPWPITDFKKWLVFMHLRTALQSVIRFNKMCIDAIYLGREISCRKRGGWDIISVSKRKLILFLLTSWVPTQDSSGQSIFFCNCVLSTFHDRKWFASLWQILCSARYHETQSDTG